MKQFDWISFSYSNCDFASSLSVTSNSLMGELSLVDDGMLIRKRDQQMGA